MQRYNLEFVLNVKGVSADNIRNSLLEFGANLEIIALSQESPWAVAPQDYKIRIHTEDPTIIFDTCSHFGRLKSVKIDEK